MEERIASIADKAVPLLEDADKKEEEAAKVTSQETVAQSSAHEIVDRRFIVNDVTRELHVSWIVDDDPVFLSRAVRMAILDLSP